MTEKQTDILIIGGGLIGAALMLALEGKGFSTLLVESTPFEDRILPDFDARTLAVSPASVRILQSLGVWPALSPGATPIDSIHVSEQGRFGTACLTNPGESPSGFVIEMQHISRAMHQVLPHQKIMAPATLLALDSRLGIATIKQNNKERILRARLIVAADGTDSTVRRMAGLDVVTKDYGQQAIVANIGLNRSHANTAWERFTPRGSLAMLPMTNQRASMVWAMPTQEARHMMALTDPVFLARLQQAFGYRLGRLMKPGTRVAFPLRQVIMPTQTAWPLVFVGNAAHTLHPVAGQGFNLGLRDVATLAQCVIQYGLDAGMARHYLAMRRYDQTAITGFTNALVGIFTNRFPGLGLARGLSLLALDTLPWLQKSLVHHAGGFAGKVPDLVCGIGFTTGGDDV